MRKTDEILKELIELLDSIQEHNWSNALSKLKNSWNQCANDQDRRQIKSQILRIFGGMGSFSDLVVYKNGKPLITENNKLDYLRRELFNSLN